MSAAPSSPGPTAAEPLILIISTLNDALTRRIYMGISASLIPAARRNLLAHLIDLAGRDLVAAETALLPDARYHLL